MAREDAGTGADRTLAVAAKPLRQDTQSGGLRMLRRPPEPVKYQAALTMPVPEVPMHQAVWTSAALTTPVPEVPMHQAV
ncbi:MAG: hypothetical protein V7631_1812 [Massilia sp.]